MTLKKAFAFSFVVTMAAMALDMMFHMATGVAVHLPYVLVKVAVVGATLLMASYWIGINKRDGLVWSLGASVLFDVYYNFAEPTLDRTVFTLDEAALYIVVHFFCIVIPYLLIQRYVLILDAPGAALSRGAMRNIIVGGVVLGALGLLPSKAFLKANGLLLGLSYNDHVLIGTLAVIAALVAGYKLLLKR
jgi:hypothetical protein